MTRLSIYVAIILGLAVTLCNAACDEVLESGVSDSDKQSALDAHNEYRRRIQEGQVPGQPKATNVKPLKWDETLAASAQDIADTCVFDYEDVDDDRFYVGQNIYQYGTTRDAEGADWLSAVEAWFAENKDFIYPNQTKGADPGHYTQLVWANTIWVGCGYIRYKEGGYYQKLYICNYGPGGNEEGEAPYEI